MSNKKSLISDCAECACKWIQKISQHSEDCEDEKYTLERLQSIKACAEFEIKLLEKIQSKPSPEYEMVDAYPGGKKVKLYTNHKAPLPLETPELNKDITQ